MPRGYLHRKGYRLPTEAEWEYACRAGAVTSRSYGESEELLGKYGWHLQNAEDRSWPVGSKKPNDTGLFDVHGNVFTWCQERFSEYPHIKGSESSDDKEDTLVITSADIRVMRGGAFSYPASIVRSANRRRSVPTSRGDNVGFRPARTFTP
jgi:formylglycine-generating enzyme required for sulfatase activity